MLKFNLKEATFCTDSASKLKIIDKESDDNADNLLVGKSSKKKNEILLLKIKLSKLMIDNKKFPRNAMLPMEAF